MSRRCLFSKQPTYSVLFQSRLKKLELIKMKAIALSVLVVLIYTFDQTSGNGVSQELVEFKTEVTEKFQTLLEFLHRNCKCASEICYYNNQFHLPGESFDSIDGCNTCFCAGYMGLVGCTRKLCLPQDDCPGGGQLTFHKCNDKEKCPIGYDCHNSKGICCPNPGCPKLNPLIFARILCFRYERCDPNTCKRCCPSYCGAICEKEGSKLVCPAPVLRSPDEITAGICAEACSPDRPCEKPNELCCSNGCGHVCMKGDLPTDPRCPKPDPNIAVRCAYPLSKCPITGCTKGLTCCPDLCGGTYCTKLP